MQLPAYLAPFRPRLLAALTDYSRERFLKDTGAGITVGIVALPLAMAFATASGLVLSGLNAQPQAVMERSGFLDQVQSR